MQIPFDLAASVDGAGWEKKVHPVSAFWHNSQVPFRGVMRNEGHLSFEVGEQGLLIGDQVLRQDGNGLYLGGDRIVEYAASAMFATSPIPANYDAVICHYYTGVVRAVRVAGTTARWFTLEVNDDGTVAETEAGSTAVANVSGLRTVRIIENAVNEVLLIGDSQFAINNVVYNIAMPSQNAKACRQGDSYYVTTVGLMTRRLPGNLQSDQLVDQTYTRDGIFLTMIGSVETANMRIDGDGATLDPTPWNLPVSTETVYSQTFHPLEPFTISRNASDPDDILYRWLAVGSSRFLQTDGTRPTTDFGRATDGLTSTVTGQFNRVYLDGQLGVVYMRGHPIAVSVSGVLITPVGMDFDGFSYLIDGDTIVVHIDGYLVKVGRSVPIRLRQMSRRSLKVNVIDPYNVIDLTRKDAVLGSLDWNNRVKPEQVLALSAIPVRPATAELVTFNSAHGANHEVTGDISPSILVGSSQLMSSSPGWRTMQTFAVAVWPEVFPVRLLDFYFRRGELTTAPEYQTTGFMFVNSALQGLAYPEPEQPTVPSPVNANFNISNPVQVYVDWGDFYHNIGLLNNRVPMDAYLMFSQITQKGLIFTISSQPYFFDGSIYSLSYDGAMLAGIDFIVDTHNMTFLGNDSTQAFFLSNDNHVWVFTGSYNLAIAYDLTRFGKFVRSNYNQNMDELAIQFGDVVLCIRKGIIRESLAGDVRRLGNSDFGNVFYDGSHAHVYGPEIDEDLRPFRMQTAFIGSSESDVVSFSNIWMRFKHPATFEVKVDVFNDKMVEGGWRRFAGVAEAQVIPKQVTGRGIRLSLRSEHPIHLAAMEHDFGRVGEAGIIRKAAR